MDAGPGAGGREGEDGVESGEKEERSLFREREPLVFFAVDCRPKAQVGSSWVVKGGIFGCCSDGRGGRRRDTANKGFGLSWKDGEAFVISQYDPQ